MKSYSGSICNFTRIVFLRRSISAGTTLAGWSALRIRLQILERERNGEGKSLRDCNPGPYMPRISEAVG